MNCIYSYWLSKPVLPGAEAGARAMAAYAQRVGAEFRFIRHDPFTDRMGLEARWFDKLRPCFDPAFDQYEKVLVVDSDVFPVEGLKQSIFDEPLSSVGFGMCEEPDQPAMRAHPAARIFTSAADRKWAEFVGRTFGSSPPRDAQGRPRTWNAGVILLTKAARIQIRQWRVSPRAYVTAARRSGLPGCYCTEQQYLNMLSFSACVPFTELSLEWNRQIHRDVRGGVYDRRNPETKFVHVMLPAADHQNGDWHWKRVNLPQSQW